MSVIRGFATLSAAVAVLVFTGAAGGTKDKDKVESKAPPELKSQTLCPVMGGKIDSTYFADVQGQRVYFCCPSCPEKFKADPDKYFKKAAAEGVLFQNIQTTCPIDGMALKDKSVYTDFEGRRIAFCGEKCRELFSKAPEKYLSKMEEAQKPAEGMESMHKSGSSESKKSEGHKEMKACGSNESCGNGL